MRELTRKFEKYLFENLGISTHLTPWSKQTTLPYFLRNLYSIYTCELLSQPWLVMAATRDAEDVTPATIRKHIGQLQKSWNHEVLYLHPGISTHNRKRLVEHKISFVVPGNQMYLPTLGVDLREYIRNLRTTKKKKFSPSTQVVLLATLYDWPKEGVTPSQLAERLGYTSMTMTRAFDEIEAASLADVTMEWRERVLRFDMDRKSLWEKSIKRLRTPVSRRFKVQGIRSYESFSVAGESALARSSMLAEPSCPVVAVSSERWKAMLMTGAVTVIPMLEPEATEVEVWKYPPELFARGGRVDPLSLYLSLMSTKDERVEIALDELMEEFPW